jgi:hypothetical protein
MMIQVSQVREFGRARKKSLCLYIPYSTLNAFRCWRYSNHLQLTRVISVQRMQGFRHVR